MFIVGLEFNVGMLRERAKNATLVAFTGIAAPFLLGGATARLLMDRAPLFNPELSRWAAAFFMGSAMCITAFPMLARILYEPRIAATSMGTLALSAGAISDFCQHGRAVSCRKLHDPLESPSVFDDPRIFRVAVHPYIRRLA